MGYFNVIEKEETLIITLGGGFFSFCSVKLDNIIHYFNTYKKLPKKIDGTLCFPHYKKSEHKNLDITHHFFEDKSHDFDYNYFLKPTFHHSFQYNIYKDFDFKMYKPFIEKYYTPSKTINTTINELENKYKINYNNTITLYYRNFDKHLETPIASHEVFMNKLNELLQLNNTLTVLLQTDDLTFENKIKNNYKNNNIIIFSEVKNSMNQKHINEFKGRTYEHGIYMLAITFIMSKTKYIICGSGNVSLWISLLRGNGKNIYQNLRLNWV